MLKRPSISHPVLILHVGPLLVHVEISESRFSPRTIREEAHGTEQHAASLCRRAGERAESQAVRGGDICSKHW